MLPQMKGRKGSRRKCFFNRQAVNRNAIRFPSHFMFKLSENEIKNMVSQFVILLKSGEGLFKKRERNEVVIYFQTIFYQYLLFQSSQLKSLILIL